MKQLLLLFNLLICGIIHSQSARIDTLTFKSMAQFQTEASFSFPKVNTGNRRTDSLITLDLLQKITDQPNNESNIKENLLSWADSMIVYMDFSVSYNTKNILSLAMEFEGCGAYCTVSQQYFNYDLISGRPLSIYDIIDASSDFQQLYINEKKAQFNLEKSEFDRLLANDNIDSDNYESSIEYLTSWGENKKLVDFKIHGDRIEIIDPCYFPHVIRCFAPNPIFNFYYRDINEMMLIRL